MVVTWHVRCLICIYMHELILSVVHLVIAYKQHACIVSSPVYWLSFQNLHYQMSHDQICTIIIQIANRNSKIKQLSFAVSLVTILLFLL